MQIIQQNPYLQSNLDDTFSQNSYAQQSYITETLSSSKKKKTGKWSDEEDQLLRQMVRDFGEKSWKKISEKMHGRSAIQCIHRWTKILKPGLVKGSWSKEEDELLQQWVKKNGPNNWAQVSQIISGRSGKQCRERWFNNLNPNVKKGNWTAEEDQIIFQQYQIHSSSWSKIAQALPGRTENSIKNRFYSTIRKITMEKEKSQNIPAKQIGLDQQEMCNNFIDSFDLNVIRKQIKLNDDSKSSYDTQLSHEEMVDFDKDITDFHDIFSEPDLEDLENYDQVLNLSENQTNNNQSTGSRKDARYNNKLYKLLSSSQLNLPQQQSLSVNGTLMRKNQKKYNYKQKIIEKRQIKKSITYQNLEECNQSELPIPQQLPNLFSSDNGQNLMSQQKFDSLLQNIEKTLDQELEIANLNNHNSGNIDKLQTQIFDFCNQTKIEYPENLEQQYPLISSNTAANFNKEDEINNKFDSSSQLLMNLFEIESQVNKRAQSSTSTQNIIEQIKLTQDLYESSQSQLALIQESGKSNKMINFLINSLQTLENLLISTKEEIQKIELKSTNNNVDQQQIQQESSSFISQQQQQQMQISQQCDSLSHEYNNNNCQQQLSESSKQIQQQLLKELEQIDEDDYENEFNDLHADNSILELLNKQNLIQNFEHNLFSEQNSLAQKFEFNNENENNQIYNNSTNIYNNSQNQNNTNLFDFDNDKYFMNSDNQYDNDQYPFVLDI